jgi:uncharacterized Zn finger protein (UPF0148 family)
VRVECESCRQLVMASFAIEGAAVRVTCPACRHVMRVPEVVSEVVGDVVGDAPGDLPPCPKCGARYRGEATACPTCGLRVARMAAYAEAHDAAALGNVPEVVPRAVEDAWRRATEDWHDAARHEELLRQVAATDSYAWAAARYRQRGPDAITARQLAWLRRAAEATLLASATARPDATAPPYRAARRVLALLITTIAAGALYAMVIRDHPLPSEAGSIPARRLTPGHPVSPSTSK